MKRMLFNATHAEELRVAIVENQKLVDLDIESAIRLEKKGNIYKGVVTKVEPSLEAAFVDFGAERQGFLPLKEIYRGYFNGRNADAAIADIKIESVISEGNEMIVQVDKDERGSKGAALTTFISLAGRFLVLMPNNPKGGGISRRISGEERAGLRRVMENLESHSAHALIIRTAGIGRSERELQADLDFLSRLWDNIRQASETQTAPFLIHQESNLIVRSIRDHLAADVAEIIVDDAEIYARAERFMQQVMPQSLDKLKRYEDSRPLFTRYQIEHQIASAFRRKVALPSGGAIVIDHTEALISIDVNSARATKGGDIEETALQTNLEAVDEAARQIRIRDLGGLIVLDLIDMSIPQNQFAVENRLKEALHADRARTQISKISRFGLLEMSRQRLRASLSEANYRACPRCEGVGVIRNVVSSALNLLRLIEEEALKENTEAIQVLVPLDIATYLLNEKRHEVNQLESRLASRIVIIPSDELASPQFHIKRLRSEEANELFGAPSYEQRIAHDYQDDDVTDSLKSAKVEQPKVRLEQVDAAAPPPPPPPVPEKAPPAPRRASPRAAKKPGILRRIWRALRGTQAKPSTPRRPARSQSRHAPRPQQRRGAPRPRRAARPPQQSAPRGRASGGQNGRRASQNSRGRNPNRARAHPQHRHPQHSPNFGNDNRRPPRQPGKLMPPQASDAPGNERIIDDNIGNRRGGGNNY